MCVLFRVSTSLSLIIVAHCCNPFPSLLRRKHVLSWLDTAFRDDRNAAFLAKTPDGQEYFKNIHGPIPYLVGNVRKLSGIRVAPQHVLDTFVLTSKNDTFVEAMTNDQLPWAISGTLGQLSAAARKNAIERCPEIKMVFPSLDNPACFGASSAIDREACIASLCVSNPKSGGC